MGLIVPELIPPIKHQITNFELKNHNEYLANGQVLNLAFVNHAFQLSVYTGKQKFCFISCILNLQRNET